MRLEGWEGRLDDYVTSTAGDVFDWGVSDCALWACGAIHSVTGDDPAADLRGTYDSRESAEKVMNGDLEVFAEGRAAKRKMAEVEVAFAQRGDLLLMDADSGPALGVVSLDGTEGFFKGLRGIAKFPVMESRRAWRVG